MTDVRSSNLIHPTTVIDGDVTLGSGNTILPYTVITGPVEIGDDNIIGPQVVIGSPCADRKHIHADHSTRPIRIGSRNVIREFTAVQKPWYCDHTVIEDDTYLMQGLHIAHDVVIERGVAVTASVSFGGRAIVMEGANLGLGTSVHQRNVVGPYSMIAMNAAITKHVRPFSKVIPGKALGVNLRFVRQVFPDYEREIVAYVLDGERPTSPQIVDLVARYERFCAGSGRDGEYSALETASTP